MGGSIAASARQRYQFIIDGIRTKDYSRTIVKDK